MDELRFRVPVAIDLLDETECLELEMSVSDGDGGTRGGTGTAAPPALNVVVFISPSAAPNPDDGSLSNASSSAS